MGASALLVLALAFAFPNEQGTHLLATGQITAPESLHAGFCTGGRQVRVEFERRQPEGRTGPGRQSAQDFANVPGAVFRIADGSVNAGAACIVADEAFFAGAKPFPLKRPPEASRCPKALYPEFQADKGRPVVACWPIAESTAGVQVAVIEFSRRLNNALASLVVVDGDRRMYVDYPATFRGPGTDLWRADDGGEIHAEGFEVVCLLKRGTTYLLAIDWKGAEGSALSLHAADSAGQFDELLTDSWYRSPL